MKKIFLPYLLLLVPYYSFAQLNSNQLYFTSNPDLDVFNATSSDVKTTFNVSEDIYAFIMTDKPIKDYLESASGNYYLESPSIPSMKGTKFQNKNVNSVAKYLFIPIVNHEDTKLTQYGPFYAMQELSALSQGSHSVKLYLKNFNDVVFSGSFTVKISGKEDVLASQLKQIDPDSRPGKGYLTYGMKQADIERDILNMLKKKYPTRAFERVVITSDRYAFERLTSGKIKARLLDADVLNERNGECTAFDFTVRQKKFGRDFGTFEEVSLNGYYPINCRDL